MDKNENKSAHPINRREFLKRSAGACLLSTAAFTLSNVGAVETTPQANVRRTPMESSDSFGVERRNEHPDMRYRRFGKTNLMVSALGLGGAYHYGPGALNDQETINKMFDKTLDLGINYFDTSPDYGTEGHFSHLAKSRERCFIATKVNTKFTLERSEGSAEGTRSEVLNSLKVMNTDYLDVVQTISPLRALVRLPNTLQADG